MTPDRQPFLDAIAADPDGYRARLVYADWLEENGEPEEAERERRYGNFLRLVSPKSLAAVFAELEKANGKRRVRTLETRHVIDAVLHAAEDGWTYYSGGTVANKYGYPATSTWVLAIRKQDGTVAVSVREGSAARNASPVSAWGELLRWTPDSAKCQERMKAWAEAR